MGAEPRYRAFISYSWQDKVWGRRIHSWLETYKIPKAEKNGAPLPKRLGRIFRDDADMPAASNIGDVVAVALAEAERAAAHGTLRDDPQSLARLATRSEIRQPGTLERSFGGMSGQGGAMGGMGGTLAGSFLASMAGVVIGSAIAQSFLSDTDVAGADAAADGTSANADTNLADASDGGADDFDMGGFDEF